MAIFLWGGSKAATGREIRMSNMGEEKFSTCVISSQLSISALSQLMKKMPHYRKEISRVRSLL